MSETFGARVRRLRLARKLEPRVLAHLAGCSKAYILTLEANALGSRNPTLAMLIGLARAFGIGLDELVGPLENYPTEEQP